MTTARTPSDRLTFDDLVDAYVCEARYRSSAKELAEYHGLRLRVLAESFECDLAPEVSDPDPTEDYDREAVSDAARSCLERYESIRGPFAIYMDGRPGPLEQRLRDGHERDIRDAISIYRRALTETFANCLRLLYPGIETRTVAGSALTERGVPLEALDPLDFW